MKTRRTTWRVLMSAVCLLASAVAPPVRAQAAAAPADDSAIAPFVDEGTFLVIRLDVESVNQDAFKEYAAEAITTMMKTEAEGLPPEALAPMTEAAKGMIGMANSWMTELAAAGGKRV